MVNTKTLRGWDWIRSLMKPCRECGEIPTLGAPAVGKKWQVCCMNICCANFRRYEDNNPYIAIYKWNNGKEYKV